jgi:hypothetical protein
VCEWGRLRRTCAGLSAAITVGLAGLHGYWAVGGTWGATTQSDGTLNLEESLPLGSRAATWGLVILMLVAALLVLGRSGLVRLGLPRWVMVAGCAFVALFAVVMLGASVGQVAGPHPGTGFLFVGVALVLFVSTLVVTLPRGARAKKDAAG